MRKPISIFGDHVSRGESAKGMRRKAIVAVIEGIVALALMMAAIYGLSLLCGAAFTALGVA